MDEVVWVLFDKETKAYYDKALSKLGKSSAPTVERPANTASPLIGFFHENEEYGCFSNWYRAEFQYAGKTFANSEQFMMYHKVLMFRKYNIADEIMNTSDPAKCKKLASQKFPEFDPKLWGKTCYTIVKRGVRAKFQQNVDILQILLGTGNALIAECSPYDNKWGIGIDIADPDRFQTKLWTGKNYLGRILMEVREELGQELALSSENSPKYSEARDAEPIPEWLMKAGDLKRIPQYYQAIHAYSDTLPGHYERDSFFYGCTLQDWEAAIRTNMGGGLPVIGFYEMKQEIYDTARRLKLLNAAENRRIAFCNKYIPVLQMIADDENLSDSCKKYSVYSSVSSHGSLIHYLYSEFMNEAYDADIVIDNYGAIVEKARLDQQVSNPTDEFLEALTTEQTLACIAWHFRRDHFSEGSLIADSIGEGKMLRMLKAYRSKIATEDVDSERH